MVDLYQYIPGLFDCFIKQAWPYWCCGILNKNPHIYYHYWLKWLKYIHLIVYVLFIRTLILLEEIVYLFDISV